MCDLEFLCGGGSFGCCWTLSCLGRGVFVVVRDLFSFEFALLFGDCVCDLFVRDYWFVLSVVCGFFCVFTVFWPGA